MSPRSQPLGGYLGHNWALKCVQLTFGTDTVCERRRRQEENAEYLRPKYRPHQSMALKRHRNVRKQG